MIERLKKLHENYSTMTHFAREQVYQDAFYEDPDNYNKDEIELKPYWIDYIITIFDHHLGEHWARFRMWRCERKGHPGMVDEVTSPESGGGELYCKDCGWSHSYWW